MKKLFYSTAALRFVLTTIFIIVNEQLLKADEAEKIIIPDRIFTEEVIKQTSNSSRKTIMFAGCHGRASNAQNSNISQFNFPSPEDWKTLLSPFAPVSCYGTLHKEQSGNCPFCGKRFTGCEMTRADLLAHPFKAKTNCCGYTVYAKESEMPENYAARPNTSVYIPHLNGKKHEYRFFIPKGYEKDKANWFCPAGEVWRARLKVLMPLIGHMIRDVYSNNNKNTVLSLIAFLDALSDIYPALPLYDGSIPHGFARGRDGESYLTQEEYLSVKRPRLVGIPFWYMKNKRGFSGHKYDKLYADGSGWQDGVMRDIGLLAQAFEIIKERPETKAWSLKKYGSKSAFEEKVLNQLFKEADLLCKSIPDTKWNTAFYWLQGAFNLGIILKDNYYMKQVVNILKDNVSNNYYSDGLSTEGAFVYATMTRPFIDELWLYEYLTGTSLVTKIPMVDLINKTGDFPITTLYNIESMHGDAHGRFMASRQMSPPPKIDYSLKEVSQCFPDYGIGVLRSGTPGNRLEAIMDFQTSVEHTHAARLNLQLFYEGINILPDIGYAVGAVDVQKMPWNKRKYNFDLVNIKNSYQWRNSYSSMPQAHCTVLIDGMHHTRGPGMFCRFLGGQKLNSPGYGMQFLEADARAVFSSSLFANYSNGTKVTWIPCPKTEVEMFRRQLMTYTLSDGRSLLFDFFRVKGGNNHSFYWHFPSESPETTLCNPQKIKQKTLQKYMCEKFKESASNNVALSFLTPQTTWKTPNGFWRTTWTVKPKEFGPATLKGKQLFKKWDDLLHDVKLDKWSCTSGGKQNITEELIAANGPWPSTVIEEERGLQLVSFKDALKYLIEVRQSAETPLYSSFINILSPYKLKEQPVITKTTHLEPTEASSQYSDAVELTINKKNNLGSFKLHVATTESNGFIKAGKLQLKGRACIIDKENMNIFLYDGSEANIEDFGISLDDSWKLKIIDIIGDISGASSQSALIVESNRKLPCDETLKNTILTVNHQISRYHSTGYTIKSISQLNASKYRIDLSNSPPFIQNTMRVSEVFKKYPCRIRAASTLTKGDFQGLYNGRNIRFIRSGFTTKIKQPLLESGIRTCLLELENSPQEGEIKLNDKFIIYTIQPGDTVVIPSYFAARKISESKNELKLALYTTGNANFIFPQKYKLKQIISNGKSIPFEITKRNKSTSTLININFLKHGKAIMVFDKKIK